MEASAMLPISNAAGWLKKPADVAPLLDVPSDILPSIMLGSYTWDRRPGNPGHVFWDDGAGSPTSLNALGLPNPGLMNTGFLDTLVPKIKAAGKYVGVSIAGFNPGQYQDMARNLLHSGIDVLEINLGCPNIRAEGKQKPIFAFDPPMIDRIMMSICCEMPLVAPKIQVKLSPYSDPGLLEEVAAVITGLKTVMSGVVTSNTFPNGFGFDREGRPVITANDGYAGLAGHAMKHIALGQVKQFRKFLPDSMDIIGVGGISSGKDVLDMQLAGAQEVQVGTAFFLHGPKVFQRIAEEYISQLEPA